jgi:hypothetical protein
LPQTLAPKNYVNDYVFAKERIKPLLMFKCHIGHSCSYFLHPLFTKGVFMRSSGSFRPFVATKYASRLIAVLVVVLSLSAMSSCAQPRYVLGGGFPGRPVAAPFYGPQFYGPQRAFIPRGQVIVPPPAVFAPRRQFAPRGWGWGGGWRGGRRWGC